MFQTYGKLDYTNSLVVLIDDEIGKYYRSLIPKYLNVKGTRYPAHISVTRKSPIPNLSVWGKYQDKEILIDYDPFIYNDETYFWINAYCYFLEYVRLELGMKNLSKYNDKFNKRKFHITIGNIKHLQSY